MPAARESLAGFLSETIRDCVRRETLADDRDRSRVMEPERLFGNLLSSQPLCFNLFGELADDLDLATRALQRRIEGVSQVVGIELEWSPGRGDKRFTGDKSAFDVFVRYEDDSGRAAFIAIEVKYHENLSDKAAATRPRHREVAAAMRCFLAQRRADLESAPLQQFWRDHVLAGSVVQSELPYERGLFAVLYPRDNFVCREALEKYESCLSDASTFAAWTMEDVVADLRAVTSASWVDAFEKRYLDFGPVDELMRETEQD